MPEIWHSISHHGVTPEGTIFAEACTEAGSPWYAGHFPAAPVLPAIAILSMVKDTISRHESRGDRRIEICRIMRVRFRLPVRPGDSLSIFVSPLAGTDRPTYRFRVERDGEGACSGMMEGTTYYDG